VAPRRAQAGHGHLLQRAFGAMRRCGQGRWPTPGRRCWWSTGRATRPATWTPRPGIDKAIALVRPIRSVCVVRGDTELRATSQTSDRWAREVDFVLGRINIAVLRPGRGAGPSAWKRLQRPARYETTTGMTRARRHNRKAGSHRRTRFVNLKLNHEEGAEFNLTGPASGPSAITASWVVARNISRAKAKT